MSSRVNRSSLETCLPDPSATDRLGAALARAMVRCRETIGTHGLALRLEGNLGAGKTSVVRAVLRELGWTGAVKSPTFSLLETYQTAEILLHHFDFYRFEDPCEFEDAGFRELFSPGAVCATEWSERAEPCLPAEDLSLELVYEGLGRRALLSARTGAGEALLKAFLEEAS